MKKRFLIIFMLVTIFVNLFTIDALCVNKEEETQSKNLDRFERTSLLIPFEDNNEYTLSELRALIQKQKDNKAYAHEMAESARKLGWAEDCMVIKLAQQTWWEADNKQKFYEQRLEDSVIYEKMEKYPTATTVWLFLKDQGYNDAVCAGIIGNMMTECGGQTLELQWWLYDYSGWFYGLCQWHKGYFPEVQKQGVDFQLQYLIDTIPSQFAPFGNDALNKFLNMTDPGEAAVVFAKRYERCANTEWNYRSRRDNAWIAYNYFVNT